MAFCDRCGAGIDNQAPICPSCGALQPGATPAVQPAGPAPGDTMTSGDSQMKENVAGLLCYVLGWITGLIFFLIDKRSFVRFHAKQSIVVFGGLFILRYGYALVMLFGISSVFGLSAIFWLIDILILVLWIVLMIKAYQGERFRIPVAADLAEQIFGKS